MTATETIEFTGKERDTETGLDYFGARYLSAAQGRFTSPDFPLLDQNLGDPQSWNLYSYVRNNPLIFTDPTGRCKQGADGKYHDSDDGPCVAPGGTSVTVTEKAPKERDHAAEAQAEMFRMQYEAWRRDQERKAREDQPLGENAKQILAQVGRNTAPVAMLADCAAASYLPFLTAAAGESIWSLGLDTVPKPFGGGGNPYTSRLSIGSRAIFGSKGGGWPSVVRGANGALRISNTNFGGFLGRSLGPLGRGVGVVGLGIGVYQTAACVAQY